MTQSLPIHHHATISVNRLSANTLTIRARQKHKDRRDLTWLTRASHRRREPLLLLLAHGGRHQRRPHRPGRHRIDPYPLAHQLIAQPPRERHNRPLGARVIQQVRPSNIRVDGRIRDDRVPPL